MYRLFYHWIFNKLWNKRQPSLIGRVCWLKQYNSADTVFYEAPTAAVTWKCSRAQPTYFSADLWDSTLTCTVVTIPKMYWNRTHYTTTTTHTHTRQIWSYLCTKDMIWNYLLPSNIKFYLLSFQHVLQKYDQSHWELCISTIWEETENIIW
jgi:hypothetical protein